LTKTVTARFAELH